MIKIHVQMNMLSIHSVTSSHNSMDHESLKFSDYLIPESYLREGSVLFDGWGTDFVPHP